ncbi:MAG: PaaI family thioesterase [Marinobacter sp.]|nr:PaaI family thioesterase [Marinobacter sp.]
MNMTNNQNLESEADNMSGFREVLGFTVTEWRPNHAVLHVEMTEQHLNRNGFVHGGVFMSLLDSAAGLCGTYCVVPGNVRRCITVSMNTHFISPVQKGRLRVEANLVSRGRKMFFVEAKISSDEGLVATGQGTFRYVLGGEREEGVPVD